MLPNAVLPLTDPDSVVDRVRQGLLNSLGSSEDLSDFKSMDEWELVNQGKISEFDLLNIYAVASDLEVIDEEELD